MERIEDKVDRKMGPNAQVLESTAQVIKARSYSFFLSFFFFFSFFGESSYRVVGFKYAIGFQFYFGSQQILYRFIPLLFSNTFQYYFFLHLARRVCYNKKKCLNFLVGKKKKKPTLSKKN